MKLKADLVKENVRLKNENKALREKNRELQEKSLRVDEVKAVAQAKSEDVSIQNNIIMDLKEELADLRWLIHEGRVGGRS